MTKAKIVEHALTLTEQERFELANTLWASLEAPNDHPTAPLPQWQQNLLDERLVASAEEIGQTWDEVQAEIWSESR